ncbi:MAG: hypothetical protein DRN27_05450 [Thermoplasmata archaeon]|nr:MAG: hypothetical protein DRN27_05450 [Thermoplasmata archaeon]
MVQSLDKKSVLLLSMPFADTNIPSIQISLLESYLKNKDINVSSIHLYLIAANIYGLHNYSFLINPPNDPYASQMVYSKYVFPKHWESQINHFKEYFNTTIAHDDAIKQTFPFEKYVEKTDTFLNWITQNISWDNYDVIGFSLNYGQFLPSLAVAQKIKQQHPEKIIVFGGSTTMHDLGLKIIESFEYIDFIITGDGEDSLYELAINNKEQYSEIPGLIARKDGKGIIHKENTLIDLDSLPFLDFTSFYQTLSMTSQDIQQYFQLNGRLPIEISRGCWWNKCSFCNQKAYHSCYREKNIGRFIEELDLLSKTYKILSFQIIGSTLPLNNYQELCKKIITLNKDFSFIAETRADRLKNKDYYYLKKAGFQTIQTGIETFSQNYIKKMNKGTQIIDNIAALKFCKEYGITNEYNIIINFPNEESLDFKETVDTTSLFKQYLDPPRTSSFVVSYKSPIYNNLEKYNIKKLKHKRTDKIMFPEHILDKNFQFFYDFMKIQETPKNKWIELVNQWKEERERLEIQSTKTKKIIDNLIFYYIDGWNFIKIYDKRSLKDVNIYILNEIEREIFLLCNNIITLGELNNKLNIINENEIQSILTDLVDNNIIYHENDSYLSLPISLSNYLGISNKQDKIEQIQESYLIT